MRTNMQGAQRQQLDATIARLASIALLWHGYDMHIATRFFLSTRAQESSKFESCAARRVAGRTAMVRPQSGVLGGRKATSFQRMNK